MCHLQIQYARPWINYFLLPFYFLNQLVLRWFGCIRIWSQFPFCTKRCRVIWIFSTNISKPESFQLFFPIILNSICIVLSWLIETFCAIGFTFYNLMQLHTPIWGIFYYIFYFIIIIIKFVLQVWFPFGTTVYQYIKLQVCLKLITD